MALSGKQLVYAVGIVTFFASTLCSEETDTSDAIRTILQSVSDNYSSIRSARGEMQYLRSDAPELQKHLERVIGVQNARPFGKVDEANDFIGLAPLKDQYGPFIHPFAILGPDIRVDGFAGYLGIVTIVRGDRLCIYQPMNNRIEIRNRGTETQMYRDPRNVFFNETMRLDDVLTDFKSVVARKFEQGKRELLRLEGETHVHERIRIEFDPAMSYLPVFAAELRMRFNSTSEVSYKRVVSGGEESWFPHKLIIKIWRTETPVTERTESGWYQKFEYSVKHFEPNAGVPQSELAVDFPKGTWVDNGVEEKYYFADKAARLP